ncbi:MAG TPA: iron ABC transporter permease [Solimonas sp.]|nr:iron ABC transporter permease [Solimonas sp.]
MALTALALATLLAAVAALGVGPMPIDAASVTAALGLPSGARPEPFEVATVLELRLPRVVLALLLGAALAEAGAAMQGLFRNPLADPGLVGVSSGAALAAVGVIVLGARFTWFADFPASWLLPLATFAGGALAAWVVARLAQVDGHTRVATMLLAGLAINAIAGAGIGFLAHVADDLALRTMTFWMFGSLGKAGWHEIAVAAPLLVAAVLLLPREARALNALLLGEAEAGHLGIAVERLKRRVSFLIVLAVGASVALAGIIGFVGLVVPHLVRLCAGPDHRTLLPASGLLGALLLLLADLGARTLLAPAELPIGILTALVGGPFFLALLVRFRNRVETA